MGRKLWKHEILTPHRKWMLKRFWQAHPFVRMLTYISVFFLIGLIIGKCTARPKTEIKEVIHEKEAVEKVVTVYKNIFILKAEKPHLVGSYGDNLQWSGSNIKIYNGSAVLKADADNDIGSLVIEFEGAVNPEEDALLDGNIKIVMAEFTGANKWQDNGIAKDVFLFGNTKKGFEYLPKTKAEIAGWGRASLYLNDALVLENLNAMFMYADGIRKPDGGITKPNGELYNLNEKDSIEFFDANEKELHFMMYSGDYDRANFPNNHVFINIYFEDVEVIKS